MGDGQQQPTHGETDSTGKDIWVLAGWAGAGESNSTIVCLYFSKYSLLANQSNFKRSRERWGYVPRNQHQKQQTMRLLQALVRPDLPSYPPTKHYSGRLAVWRYHLEHLPALRHQTTVRYGVREASVQDWTIIIANGSDKHSTKNQICIRNGRWY